MSCGGRVRALDIVRYNHLRLRFHSLAPGVQLSDQRPPSDHEKWTYELNVEHAQRAHDKADDFFASNNEAAIKTSELALRTLMLINGGAAVAMLAFIGGLTSKGTIVIGKFGTVADSLTWFAVGVACAAAGTGLAYGTHYC